MENTHEQPQAGCCPRFDPGTWDGTEVTLLGKLFLKCPVRALFYVPLDFNRVVARAMTGIRQEGAFSAEPLMFACAQSPWRTDVYIAVDRDVPGGVMERVTGTFLARVFEGPCNRTGAWLAEMRGFVHSRSKTIRKLYFFYTICPECARYYDRKYTVLLAQV